ncbi:MAG: serine hydrolase domain-containing protein [Ilumatobacteraceae bacterium]
MGVSVHGGPPTILVSGVSDPKLKTPMKPDDVVYIASNTKTFVGALVLLLVSDGKVSLDAPINSYGLDFPYGDVITVGELLTHTSGIPPEGSESGTGSDLYAAEFQAKIFSDLAHAYTMAEIVAYVRDRPLLFPPGTSTGYSNVNTILAAQIVEKVTDQTLTQQLQTRLFTPLRLTSTYYTAQETPVVPPVPVVPGLFTLQPGGAVLNTADFDETALLTAIGPAGAMASNATDMLTWGDALLRTGTVLGPDLSKSAHEIGSGGTGLGVIGFTHNGFCTFDGSCSKDTAAFTGVGGSGSVPGTRSLLVYDTTTDTVIFLAANLQPLDGLDQAAIAEFDLIAASQK